MICFVELLKLRELWKDELTNDQSSKFRAIQNGIVTERRRGMGHVPPEFTTTTTW